MAISAAAGAAIAGGLAAAGTIGGSAAQSIATSNLNKKNRKWQEQMYEKQRANYLQDLENERAYNSASAQMQRLRDAGLNPNLLFGDGQVAGLSSGAQNGATVPTPATYGYDIASPIASAMSQLSSGVLRSSELDIAQQNADTAKQNSHVALFNAYTSAIGEMAKARNLDADTALRNIDVKYRDAFNTGQVEKISSEIDMNNQRSFNLLQQSITAMSLRDAQKAELLAKVEQLRSSASLMVNQIPLVMAQTSESRARKGAIDETAQLTFVQREWQEFQNSMKDLYRTITSSSASKSEKEAAMFIIDKVWGNLNSSISAASPLIGAMVSKGKNQPNGGNIYQGYTISPSNL